MEFSEKQFWDFHLKELRKLGVRIQPILLIKEILIKALDIPSTILMLKKRLNKKYVR